MYHTFYITYIPWSKYRIYTCWSGAGPDRSAPAWSSLHFVRGFALLDERLPLGGVTPSALDARPVVGVAHGRRAGEAGRGAAASLRRAAAAAYANAAALAQLLARRRGAERALQGG